jgi:hypothetical protein
MTAKVTPPPVRPVSVWDARGRDWENPQQAGRCAWLKANRFNAAEIYRAEIYVLDDEPFIRVFTYARNEHGLLHLVPGTRTAAVAAPMDVPILGLPPKELL